MKNSSKHFVVQLTFSDGPPPSDAMQAQRSFLRELLSEGTLVMAGRFADGQPGGMSILRAASLDAARDRFREAPLVTGGHAEWHVREWHVTVGVGA